MRLLKEIKKKINLDHTVQGIAISRTSVSCHVIWTFDNDCATLKHKRIWTFRLPPNNSKSEKRGMNKEKVVAVFRLILPFLRAPLVTLLLSWLNGSLEPRGENAISLRLSQSSDAPSQALWSGTNRSPGFLVPAPSEVRG